MIGARFLLGFLLVFFGIAAGARLSRVRGGPVSRAAEYTELGSEEIGVEALPGQLDAVAFSALTHVTSGSSQYCAGCERRYQAPTIHVRRQREEPLGHHADQ